MRSATNPEIVGFEIVSVLGGTRSTVYRARELASGDDVVVKLLDRAKEPILPKRFDRARKALVRLCGLNPGFVPMLANGVTGAGDDYIVSPYYRIGSLEDQVEQGPMPWRPAAELMSKVADIVAHAHDESIVLGDLRPSNILLEAAGKPKVAAMGMATRRFDDGTPVFNAPERGDDKTRLTSAADVYSLSLIFGALIAGAPKPRSQSDQDYLEELRPLLPARFFEVIEHGLAGSPTNRYRNAATMERAIRVAMEADPDKPQEVETDDGSEPLDIDEIRSDPIDGPDPQEAGPPTVAERLPPGLEDIVFAASQEPVITENGDDLSLPAGLEDLTLVDQNLVDGNGNGHLDPVGDGSIPGDGHEEDTTLNGLEESNREADPSESLDLTDGQPGDDGAHVDRFDDLGGAKEENGSVDDLDSGYGFDAGDGRDRAGNAMVPTALRGGPNGTDPARPPTMPSESLLAAATTTLDLDLEGLARGTAPADDLHDRLDPESPPADEPVDRFDRDLETGRADEADDQTSVLDLNDFEDGPEDRTTVLDFAELREPEDETSVFAFAHLSGGEDLDRGDEDRTTVLDLDELDRLADLEAEGPVETSAPIDDNGDDDGKDNGKDDGNGIVDGKDDDDRQDLPYDYANDSDYGVDTGHRGDTHHTHHTGDTGDTDDDPPAPSPPELPAGRRAYRSKAAVVFSQDQTDVFGDADRGPDFADDETPVPAGAAMVGPLAAPYTGGGLTGEEIPFAGVSRIRQAAEPQTWLDRTWVAVEVAWFRSRRSVASMAAVLGLLAIAGIAIFFLAKEVTSNVTETEGVPLAPTTVTSSPNYVPTDAPYVTDPPQTHTTVTTTTTAAPRRRATTAAPTTRPTAPAPPSTVEPSTSAPSSTPPSSAPPSTSPPSSTPPSSTVDVLPTTGPGTEAPRTTRSRRTTTTKAAKSTTTEGENSGTPAGGSTAGPPDSQHSRSAVQSAAVQAPTIVSLDVIGVQQRSASVRYASDQCVATRFSLSGDDGSTQTGSSPGFDPAIRCSAAWNLDFKGSWKLEPDTSYVLQMWVKGRESGLTETAQVSFSTTG